MYHHTSRTTYILMVLLFWSTPYRGQGLDSEQFFDPEWNR
jgi:hypothetical protein